MSNQTLNLTDELRRYMLSVSLRESETGRQLREETAKDPMSAMQIAPEQGQFMALLARLINARKVLEIGVFTGYSALCVAETLPADGKLVACDNNETWTSIARRYWRMANVDNRIELLLAPAISTLEKLCANGEQNSFDMAFIDADKENISIYYEQALSLLRPGGLLIIDNVLWGGSVINPNKHDNETMAIRALNRKVHADTRIEMCMLPVADGLTLVFKKINLPEATE